MYNAFFLDNAYIVGLIIIAIVVSVGFVLHRYSYRVSKEDSFMSQFAGWVPQLLLIVLVSVWLNNLFQAVRERDTQREQRKWELRQNHLVRLRPVLLADAEHLSITARKATEVGRISGLNKGTQPDMSELESLFSPDLLTADLANHFPDYWQARQQLWKDVERQDAEFGDTVARVSTSVHLPSHAENQRVTVGRAFLEKCMGKGPGFTLEVSKDSYSYRFPGGGGGSSSGGNVRPPEYLTAILEGFQSIKLTTETMKRCETLTKGAASITTKAMELSRQAQLLAERTVLTGDCEYIKLD